MSYGKMSRGGYGTGKSAGMSAERIAPGKRTLTESLVPRRAGFATASARAGQPRDGAEEPARGPAEQPHAEGDPAAASVEGEVRSIEVVKAGSDGESSSQDGMNRAGGGEAAASMAPEREVTFERVGRAGVANARAIASRNPSDFPTHLGETQVRFGSARVEMTGTVRGSTYNMKFKRSAMPSLTFPVYLAAPAGTTRTGSVERENSAGETKSVALKYVVTPAIHAEIVTAEGEHYSDYQRAFQLSLKAGVDAVNSLLTQTFTGSSQDEAVDKANQALADKLNPRLGSDPTQWAAVMQELVDLSPAARDATDNHTWNYTEAQVDWTTNSVTRTFDHNPNIGTQSSATVIHL